HPYNMGMVNSFLILLFVFFILNQIRESLNADTGNNSQFDEEHIMLSIDSVKKQAQVLKSFLDEKFGDVSHSSCLQAIAKINGYKDWNTMQSIIKNNSGVDMSDDIAERLESLEFYVQELAKDVDKIQAKVDEHDPYILELQGVHPWNPPD
ncbi:TPA: glyoxalase superfamily protein, partial [Legionella pneumophila]